MYKNLILQKIERGLRSEFTLHLLLMFAMQSILFVFLGDYYFLWYVPLVLGLLKEISDVKLKKGSVSYTDILGTVVGGLLAMIVSLGR